MHTFIPYAAGISVVLAQVPVAVQGEWWSPLVNAGAMGVVLLFFMWQSSKKEDERIVAQRELAKALNSSTMGNMVIVLALQSLDGNIKDLARRVADDASPQKS